METQELQNILEQLKEELAGSHFEDASSETELTDLIDLIEQALVDDENAVRNALNEPINDAVTRFESSHPQLTSLLNTISSLFSNMGI